MGYRSDSIAVSRDMGPLRSVDPPHPGSHRTKNVYVYVPFPFLKNNEMEKSTVLGAL